MRRASVPVVRALPVAFGLALAWAVVGARVVGAQQIRGRVSDESNGGPVPMAGVFLLSADRGVVSSFLADSEGRYVLDVPGSGEYILRVQRLGYYETESPLLAVSGDRPYDVDLTVRPEPIRIEGIEVEIPFERQNSWAKDRLDYMDPRWGLGNPAEGYGFRLITGLRLEEARMRSEDTLDLLRWVYVPVFNNVEGVCVQMRADFARGGGSRAMAIHDPPVPRPTCGTVILDGQPLEPEHIASLDFRSINAVMVVGGTLHLMTVEFERRFQERSRR